jgi:hypothetical protein
LCGIFPPIDKSVAKRGLGEVLQRTGGCRQSTPPGLARDDDARLIDEERHQEPDPWDRCTQLHQLALGMFARVVLVIDVRTGPGESELLAFIVSTTPVSQPELTTRIAQAIRASLSPRSVPDRVYTVPAIPRTLSMKKQELPIKRLFEGRSLTELIDPAAMTNPECLDDYVDLAHAFRAVRNEADDPDRTRDR